MNATDRTYLVVQGGPDDGRTIALGEELTSLGRHGSSDIVVRDKRVSRHHAEIEHQKGAYYLRDLGSRNGTFVNAQRASDGRTQLRNGDTISFGGSVSYLFLSQAGRTQHLTVVLSSDDLQAEPPPEKQEERDEGVYEGIVRLKVFAAGDKRAMADFTHRLKHDPAIRLVRETENDVGGMELWLALTEPVALRQSIAKVRGVAAVSPTRRRDLSPESRDTPLTVLLGLEEPPAGPPVDLTCFYCKEPLKPGTNLCPACHKTQA